MKLSYLLEQAQYQADLAEQLQQLAELSTHKLTTTVAKDLAQVDHLVESMRASLSFPTLNQSIPLLQDLSLIPTQAISRVMSASLDEMRHNLLQVAKLISTAALESLRDTQKTWLSMVQISTEFAQLQVALDTNLMSFLQEQADYYQSWLDAGDDYDKFTEAFVLCATQLSYIAIRIVGNTEDAKDVVQDSYEKAWRVILTYSMNQIRRLNVLAWLTTIVKNTAKNFRRDQRHWAPYETAWMEQLPDRRFDQPETHLVRRELLQVIYKAFKVLSPIQHKIIFMRFLGTEASLQDIADYLECPIGTVKGNLSRGLARLRQELKKQNFSFPDLEEFMEVVSSWPYSAERIVQLCEIKEHF